MAIEKQWTHAGLDCRVLTGTCRCGLVKLPAGHRLHRVDTDKFDARDDLDSTDRASFKSGGVQDGVELETWVGFDTSEHRKRVGSGLDQGLSLREVVARVGRMADRIAGVTRPAP